MSAPFKDATNDAVQFLTKHGDLTRAAAYDAIRLLTGNGFVVTQTDMLPSATDLSQAAVAAALEAAAAICADHMAVALQDEKDPEALKGYARGGYFAARQQGIEIRAQITQPQHDALAAHVAAEVAKARAEDAVKLDVGRKLKETLFAIINHETRPRNDAYYGGVLVDTPDGPRTAYLRLTFEAIAKIGAKP